MKGTRFAVLVPLLGLLAAGCLGVVGIGEDGAPSGTNASLAASSAKASNASQLNHTTGSWEVEWSEVRLVDRFAPTVTRGPNCIFLQTTEDFRIEDGYVAVDWTPPTVNTFNSQTILRIGGGEGFLEYFVEHRLTGDTENYTVEVDGWAPYWPNMPADMLVGFIGSDGTAYVGVDQSGTIRVNFHHEGGIKDVRPGSCT